MSGSRRDEPSGPRYFGPPLEREALEFEGVTFRVFPLKANPHRLERFCDDYLNRELPPEIARFRPAMPLVLLEVINYGRMSPRASNLGWLSQNEVVFAVPVEWYRRESGRWRFVDWATVSPFIFVDDDLSTAEGREIYGWPKVLSAIEAEADPWMEDPRSRRRLLTLRTQMFSELYAGKRLEMLPLLQIEQRLPEAATQWMPDLSYLARPLLGPSGALMAGVGTLADLSLGAVNRWREVGDPGFGVMGEALRRGLQLGPRELHGNTINLKQFRGGEPHTVCYQALVNARFTFKKFHAGGPLGDVELLRGDPSGGFRLRIHRHPAYPIIESLGLEVASEERGRGRPISLLRPQLPSWFRADTRYEMGERIAWRIESRDWRPRESRARQTGEGSGRARRPPLEGAGVTDSVGGGLDLPDPGTTGTGEARPRYNTSLGPVISSVQGPFDFWDASVRVITLQADAAVLEKFVADRLALPPEVGRIELEPPRELHFMVKDEKGFQLPGVEIVLEADNAKLSHRRITGTDGRASFDDTVLDRDVWELTASLEGFAPYQQPRISVRALRGRTFEITLTMGVEESITVFEHGGYENSVPVLLKVASYGRMSTAANDIGRWAERDVGIAIPVWFLPPDGSRWMPVLFWTHVFSDSPIAVRTDREVSGLPTSQARISGGLDRWAEGVDGERALLSVTTGAFPALHVGARRRQKVLLRIEGSPGAPAERGFLRKDEDEPEVYGGGLELDNLAVKQFRDAENPRLACYQAIVAARTFVGRWHRPGSRARAARDPTSYRVFIHEYESQPLVRELGLCVKPTRISEDGSRYAEVKPYNLDRADGDEPKVHALSMLVDMRHDASQTVCWRGAGVTEWTIDDGGVAYLSDRARKHVEEINNFGTFIDALEKRIDNASGLRDD